MPANAEIECDYLIIGAGSAGCVLANRLSASGTHQVVLLEAGSHDAHLYVRMPSAFSLPMGKPRFDWSFESEVEQGLGRRRLACPRGRLLGGSSSINGMVYVRGHPRDYERWAELGADGWDFSHVLPYFQRAENAVDAPDPDGWRGHDGPLVVSRGVKQNPLYDAFVEAGVQAGHAHSEDLNGYRQEGVGDLERTVHNGIRWSTARAYLAPARKRPNLRVVTGALVDRLIFDGDMATGVTCRIGRSTTTIRARTEVVLSAGSIGSPSILMRSGVGPESDLRELNIPVTAPSPEVGHNLQDHLEVYFQQECTAPVSLNRSLNLFGKAQIGARWLAFRDGPGATNHFETGGFICSDANAGWPDIQFHFLPAAVRYDGTRAAEVDGYQAHIGPMRSPSRGRVRLRSANPADDPRIHFNYMSHADDWRVFRQSIRAAREIFAQPALARFGGAEISPGSAAASDAELDDFVRAHAESAYHPCGTCRMGRDDDAVVDSECRVNGVNGLRVVDSSIFPQIPNGNLNGPTIMLAEKAADAILGHSLPHDPRRWFERTTASDGDDEHA